MEAIAKARNVKGSPQKARLVIDMIRGRNVSQALAILNFTNKRAAKPIARCLRSAIANATYKAEQQNIAVDPDDLWITECYVDMGVHKNRRRLRPAPQGRAYQEQRHYCHITIEVSSETPEMPVVKMKKSGNKIDEEQIKLKEAAAQKRKKAKAEKPKAEKKEEKAEAKDTKAESNEEVVVEKPNVDMPEAETASEEKVEAKADAKEEITAEEATEEKAEASSEDKKEDTAEAKAEEKTEPETAEEAEKQAEEKALKDDSEKAEAKEETPAIEETAKETLSDNKPLAAQTDEEKTGTDEAADRQVDENEDLERQ